MTAALTLGLSASIAAEPRNPRSKCPTCRAISWCRKAMNRFSSARPVGRRTTSACRRPAGVAWKFLGPQATLFLPVHGGHSQQQITTHFLSPNPEEGGTARATWQHSFDSSRVWAFADRISTDANYVAPGAIPWLRLVKVGTETGPDGGSILAQTTFIQRLNTSGGVAPATGCTQAIQHRGDRARAVHDRLLLLPRGAANAAPR